MSDFKPSLVIENGMLRYQCEPDQIAWSTPVDDLLLIAEYTTNEGPAVDDYFFIFFYWQDGEPKVSEYASTGDIEHVLEGLSQHFKTPMSIKLVTSTKWASRIIWPTPLADREYFTVTKRPPDSLWLKFRKYVLRDPVHDFKPCASVWQHIESERLRRSRPYQDCQASSL